jgi:hypothetical protein
MEYIDAKVGTIAVSGAVGRNLWRALSSLAERHPALTVVVADGTKLFIENTDLLIFQKLGAKLVGYRGINLTGITLNPFSPMGGSFEAAEFLDVAKNAFVGYDVCDVVLEATSDEKIKETGEVA